MRNKKKRIITEGDFFGFNVADKHTLDNPFCSPEED